MLPCLILLNCTSMRAWQALTQRANLRLLRQFTGTKPPNLKQVTPQDMYFSLESPEKQEESSGALVVASHALVKHTQQLTTTVPRSMPIELAIFKTYLLPQLQKQLLHSMRGISAYTKCNPALTTGPHDFQDYPLVKLLNFGLQFVEEGMRDVRVWMKLEHFIRQRLHRCPFEDSLRLMHIMLTSYSFFCFKREFIVSVLVGIKKEIPVASESSLRVLFYLCNAQKWKAVEVSEDDERKSVFSNDILQQMQTQILVRMTAKFKEYLQDKKRKAKAPLLTAKVMSEVYYWACFSLAFTLRNNFQKLNFEYHATEMVQIINQLFAQIATKPISWATLDERDMLSLVQMQECMGQLDLHQKPVQKSLRDSPVPEKNIFEELEDLRKNMLMFHRGKIIKTLQSGGKPEEKCMLLNALLRKLDHSDISFIEQYLASNQPDTHLEGASPEDTRRKNIRAASDILLNLPNDSPATVYEKVRLISKLRDSLTIDNELATKYYSGIVREEITQLQLPTVYEMIKLELLLSFEAETPPVGASGILSFLADNEGSYRHLDWLSFNFLLIRGTHSQRAVMRVLGSRGNRVQLIGEQSEDSEGHYRKLQQIGRLIRKIRQDARRFDHQELIRHEIKFLSQQPETLQLEKFFKELRMHDVQKLQLIEEPFQRVAQFVNKSDRIVILSKSPKDGRKLSARLEKYLLNLNGWKVVMLDYTKFLDLQIDQRVKLIGEQVQKEGVLVDSIRQPLLLLNH